MTSGIGRAPAERSLRMPRSAIVDSRGDDVGQLIVRNVSDQIVRALKRRAARHGRSAEAEHREILRVALSQEADRSSFKSFLASLPEVGSDEDFVRARDLPRAAP
jgi:antitoxin FitA